ncbi:cbb3-type cytochrome oxidase subunit 3 [Falsiroseomonas sp.]|uniref:cbb3-type cytochrome oxidase subunit 3 n=1 Tax=Falsiroseomonas sp. TaxID=2870721 RepID=UPI0034A41CDD
MLDTLASMQSTLSTLWVVWFFVLFTGIILYVMSPWRKRGYERAGDIPLRDEPPARQRRDERPSSAANGGR